MANSHFDSNHVATITAVLNTTGTDIVTVKVNAADHGLFVNDGSGGSDHGPANAIFDDNHVPVLMATSSVDGVTPVAVYADSSGHLLIKSS